jgi:hypothetical protein
MLSDNKHKERFKSILVDKIKEETKKHYEVPAKKIIFTPDSLFTEKFLDDLRIILCKKENSSEKFRKMKRSEKQKIVDQLEELLQTETRWKDLVRSSKYDSEKIREIFPEETEQFKELYFSSFVPQPQDKKDRQKQMRGSEKTKKFLQFLFQYIQESHFSILTDNGRSFSYSAEQLTEVIDSISPIFLFQDIIKICMKKAYDTNINIESNNPKSFSSEPLNTSFLKAKKTDLIYPLFYYLNIYLTSILLNDLAHRKLLVKKEIEYIIDTLKFFEQRFTDLIRTDMTKYPWFLYSTEIAHILIDILEGTSVIKDVVIEKSKKEKLKTHTVFIFDHKLDNSIAFSKHLPRIIPPKKAESSQSIYSWVAPLKRGTFNVQVSEDALTALNNAQKKEFVINTNFLDLLREVDYSREEVSEFPTQRSYYRTLHAYSEWSDSAWNNLFDLLLYKCTSSILRVKKRKKEDLHFKTITLCGISSLECYANIAKNQSRIDVLRKKQMRQLLQTSIDIGKLYKGYPLYYSTLLDFRLRMYPLQYLMSRTSGYLKNLLQEDKPRALKQKGLKNMLEAYYSPDPALLFEFKSKNLATKKQMFYFFQERKVKLEGKPLYFELLEKELEQVFTSKCQTSLLLEIDQVGSGPAFVALLTKNTKLAEKCNLIGGDFRCIYSFLLEETSKFFLHNNNFDLGVDLKESKAYKLLTKNRKAQKYALMCYFYNEQHLSRTNRWKEQYEEVFGLTVSDHDFEILKKFSIEYPRFMDVCFPNLGEQLNILNEAMLILVKQNLPVKINTLDGCILSWDFENSVEIKKNYYNPVSKTHDQFKFRVNVKEKKNDRTKIQKHKLSFRPNLIHSIDASIMRIFLQEFYNKTKKRLNHLHDCVMMHPNDVDVFYDIVTEVYCRPVMKRLAEELVFSRMKSDLTGEPLEKVIQLEKQFLKNMGVFDLTPTTFDPRKCYRYEGAK